MEKLQPKQSPRGSNSMRNTKLTVGLAALLVLVFLAGATIAGKQACDKTDIDGNQWGEKDLEKLMLENNVPALGIGIIEDGVLRQVKVYGELTKTTPAPYNAIFNVASLTKPISTLLTLRLVSNGDWNLDEPLYHYWVDPDVKNDPLHKKLTTRHVLTHQTGFDNWRWMNDSRKLKFNFEPGTEVKYSGEGIEYLRLAIEQKFNKPFEALVDSIIFKPYGMNDSRFLWDESMHKSRYAEEHNNEGEPYELVKRTKDASAADDVLTTIGDYCIFGVNVLKGTGLTKEIYKDMVRPQAIVRENVAYGLGWYIKQDFYEGEDALTATGGDLGVCTKVILLPESKRGIVLFANGDNGFELIKKVEAEFFAIDDLLSEVKVLDAEGNSSDSESQG
jgi:CubicO group peptidase (beta-lactamase class C family)